MSIEYSQPSLAIDVLLKKKTMIRLFEFAHAWLESFTSAHPADQVHTVLLYTNSEHFPTNRYLATTPPHQEK